MCRVTYADVAMTAPIRQAMILAAGLGTRMRPLTAAMPKPLVPLLNIPSIYLTLEWLRAAGVETVMINLHYLGEMIRETLGDGRRFGLSLNYSDEPELLGTGGGVKKVESFFGDSVFYLVNCDFVTNCDLAVVARTHQQREALATMVLYENSASQPRYSRVGVDGEQHLCSLPGRKICEPYRGGIFTGIHVLAPETLRYLPDGASDIVKSLYLPLMEQHPDHVYGAFVDEMTWQDTGDLDGYWRTSMELLTNGSMELILFERFGFAELAKGVWAPRGTMLPVGVEIIPPVVLDQDVRVGREVVIGPSVVLGAGATVENQARVRETVVLPRAVVPANTECERAIVFERERMQMVEQPRRQERQEIRMRD